MFVPLVPLLPSLAKQNFTSADCLPLKFVVMEQYNTSSPSIATVPIANLVSSGVLGLCFLLGIPGNITVMVVILHNLKKDNFTLQLMLNLAASDILCLITLPLWIHYLLVGWSFSQAVCKLLAFFVYVSLYTSVMTVTLMSVQRYFAVLYSHQWAKLGRKGEKTLLICLWLLACILSSPAAVSYSLKKKGIPLVCEKVFNSDRQKAAVYIFETLLGFIIPFSILVTSYSCLHKKVNETAFFCNKRLTRLVTNIVVTFFILWIPVHVVNIVDVVAVALKSSSPDASAKLFAFSAFAEKIVGSLSFINSCVNPILYAFASQRLLRNTDSSNVRDNAKQRCLTCFQIF